MSKARLDLPEPEAGDHRQALARDINVDSLEVVLARAADGNMSQHRGLCSSFVLIKGAAPRVNAGRSRYGHCCGKLRALAWPVVGARRRRLNRTLGARSMKHSCVLALLLLSTAAAAEIPTPARPVSDPRTLASPSDPQAAPVPIGDLVFSRGVYDAAWSADGRQLFVSTNLTGRYSIWRMNASGSWPVQLTQSDDSQGASRYRQMAGRSIYTQDKGGNEQY